MSYADDFGSTEPRCPDCGVVMRGEDAGWSCPECRHFEPIEQGPLPPSFDGPSIGGG